MKRKIGCFIVSFCIGEFGEKVTVHCKKNLNNAPSMTKRHAPPPPISAEILILSGRATIRVNYWFADT